MCCFKARRAGQMETPFVKHLVNTFQSCKETLSVFSQVMEDWVRMFIPPCTAFMIEGLSEAAMHTQPDDMSLEYWGRPDNATVSGVTDGYGADASDPYQ
ncbi:hypothetical protein BBAD15_g6919 [Beauveria bassiana D1-5]|uniref:Uncharacterized protein n=1 Tax=Beauveria bassiana D1-5 TaxID=1245745 RepID=A0A0A2VJJ4_BEABA|nr:hypothetical protein BBAD15_g6919 [Beauveria bassiana D1-5]